MEPIETTLTDAATQEQEEQEAAAMWQATQSGNIDTSTQEQAMLDEVDIAPDLDLSGKRLESIVADEEDSVLRLKGLHIAAFVSTFNQALHPPRRPVKPFDNSHQFAPTTAAQYSRNPPSYASFKRPLASDCAKRGTRWPNELFGWHSHEKGQAAQITGWHEDRAAAKIHDHVKLEPFESFDSLTQHVPTYALIRQDKQHKLPSGLSPFIFPEVVDESGAFDAVIEAKSPLPGHSVTGSDGIDIPRFSPEPVAVVKLLSKPFSALFAWGPPI